MDQAAVHAVKGEQPPPHSAEAVKVGTGGGKMERPREERKVKDRQSHPNQTHQARVKERARNDRLIRTSLMHIAPSAHS